jgi:hypothetical protein
VQAAVTPVIAAAPVGRACGGVPPVVKTVEVIVRFHTIAIVVATLMSKLNVVVWLEGPSVTPGMLGTPTRVSESPVPPSGWMPFVTVGPAMAVTVGDGAADRGCGIGNGGAEAVGFASTGAAGRGAGAVGTVRMGGRGARVGVMDTGAVGDALGTAESATDRLTGTGAIGVADGEAARVADAGSTTSASSAAKVRRIAGDRCRRLFMPMRTP